MVEIRSGIPVEREVEAFVVPWFDDAPSTGESWETAAAQWLESRGNSGEASAWVRLGAPDSPDVFIARLSAGERPVAESCRRAAGAGVRAARARGFGSVGLRVPEGADEAVWQASAEGLALGDWRYDGLRDAKGRTAPPETRVLFATASVPPEAPAAVRRGCILAEAQNVTRELVTLPGNTVTPRYLAETAERLGREHGFRTEVRGRDRLEEEGFGALLAVSRGSVEEPCFIEMEHEGSGGAPFVVVGKGVTFDAGGISLKPASGMEDMKYDMAGAAAVLGILMAAARLDIPQRVIGLVPATENLPSGNAVKPGDVVRGLSGKSIEVINTDAEGRLILSDALTYAQRLDPAAIIDMATLTGACVIALGHHAVAVLTASDGLADELAAAGERTGERTWPLPLWKEYRAQLDSHIADIKNIGGRGGGTITGGWFLREFVADDVRWAHLDIAGTAWAEEARGWQPKGATGVGVRLVHEWLRSHGRG
ncbi:leucyl aminopeptidase [Candidatus Palauibacter sp.]|uniref:leucyl aminopeptidase n=1 Tax=Candidatus Palauibacter sp. TaxID=3101350 RepID=UPI003B02ACA7